MSDMQQSLRKLQHSKSSRFDGRLQEFMGDMHAGTLLITCGHWCNSNAGKNQASRKKPLSYVNDQKSDGSSAKAQNSLSTIHWVEGPALWNQTSCSEIHLQLSSDWVVKIRVIEVQCRPWVNCRIPPLPFSIYSAFSAENN